jgi:hypothetical protein
MVLKGDPGLGYPWRNGWRRRDDYVRYWKRDITARKRMKRNKK